MYNFRNEMFSQKEIYTSSKIHNFPSSTCVEKLRTSFFPFFSIDDFAIELVDLNVHVFAHLLDGDAEVLLNVSQVLTLVVPSTTT